MNTSKKLLLCVTLLMAGNTIAATIEEALAASANMVEIYEDARKNQKLNDEQLAGLNESNSTIDDYLGYHPIRYAKAHKPRFEALSKEEALKIGLSAAKLQHTVFSALAGETDTEEALQTAAKAFDRITDAVRNKFNS